MLYGIRDEKRTHANTAARVGDALLELLSLLTDAPYLRKDIDDSAAGVITLVKGLAVGKGIHGIGPDGLASLLGVIFEGILKSKGASPSFSDGKGIWMDAQKGTIAADGLDVRGWMRVAKLVYNMVQVLEQDYRFSGGADIERVTGNGDGTFTLHFHKEKEGRHVTFADFDILFGKVDELTDSGLYYTSWMRVCEGGITLNDGMTPDTARVELWEDGAVPGGRNFPPRDMMTVARSGNTRNEERQSYWELSTTDERIAYLWHVDQPVLRADNYALCLGILPNVLDEAGVLPGWRDRRMPSLYVNTVFYENAHHIYYPPRIVKEDRGEWTTSPTAVYTGMSGTWQGEQFVQGQAIAEPYHFESFSRNAWLTQRLSPAHRSLTDEELRQRMMKGMHVEMETSRVWHWGALWECLAEGTSEEPGLSPRWTMVSGQPVRVDFFFSRGTLVWIDDVRLTVEARILIGSADVTDELLEKVRQGTIAISWKWERMAFEDGTQTAADELWQPTTEPGRPNVLVIDHRLNDPERRTDCGPLWESDMHVWFRCTARLSTGTEAEGEMGVGKV